MKMRDATMTVKTLNNKHKISSSRKSKILQGRESRTSLFLRSNRLSVATSNSNVACHQSSRGGVFGRRYCRSQLVRMNTRQQPQYRCDRHLTSRCFSQVTIAHVLCIFYIAFYNLESFLESIIYTGNLEERVNTTALFAGGLADE